MKDSNLSTTHRLLIFYSPINFFKGTVISVFQIKTFFPKQIDLNKNSKKLNYHKSQCRYFGNGNFLETREKS